jgi:hypothetical protein
MMSDVRKCMKFPVVALPGVAYMPALGEDEKEAAQVVAWVWGKIYSKCNLKQSAS